MDKKLLSIGETAQFLGVSVDTLRLWDQKNILPSFRSSPTGKRYYRIEDVTRLLQGNAHTSSTNLTHLAKTWVANQGATSLPPEFYCETNDIFSARLQSLSLQFERVPEMKDIFPLVIAIIGEIGNNSFNHNIGNWPDVPGVFFAHDISKREVVLADRGRGVLLTLRHVLPQLSSHQDALQVAFTQYISAREPEDRGNGLKFVRDIVLSNHFCLKFYSGNAVLNLEENSTDLEVKVSDMSFHGSFIILHY